MGVGFGSLGEATLGMSVGTKSEPAHVLDNFLEQIEGGGGGGLFGMRSGDLDKTMCAAHTDLQLCVLLQPVPYFRKSKTLLIYKISRLTKES